MKEIAEAAHSSLQALLINSPGWSGWISLSCDEDDRSVSCLSLRLESGSRLLLAQTSVNGAEALAAARDLLTAAEEFDASSLANSWWQLSTEYSSPLVAIGHTPPGEKNYGGYVPRGGARAVIRMQEQARAVAGARFDDFKWYPDYFILRLKFAVGLPHHPQPTLSHSHHTIGASDTLLEDRRATFYVSVKKRHGNVEKACSETIADVEWAISFLKPFHLRVERVEIEDTGVSLIPTLKPDPKCSLNLRTSAEEVVGYTGLSLTAAAHGAIESGAPLKGAWELLRQTHKNVAYRSILLPQAFIGDFAPQRWKPEPRNFHKEVAELLRKNGWPGAMDAEGFRLFFILHGSEAGLALRLTGLEGQPMVRLGGYSALSAPRWGDAWWLLALEVGRTEGAIRALGAIAPLGFTPLASLDSASARLLFDVARGAISTEREPRLDALAADDREPYLFPWGHDEPAHDGWFQWDFKRKMKTRIVKP